VGWEQVRPWLIARAELPVERLSASSTGPPADDLGQRRGPPRAAPARHARGRAASVRAASAAPCARARAGPARAVPLNIIQRQLGHANLGTTSIDPARDRPRGDHRCRPRAARPDDVGQRRTPALSNALLTTAGAPPALPLRRTQAGLRASTPALAPRPQQEPTESPRECRVHAEAELSLRIDRSVCPGRPLPQEARPAARRLPPCRRRWPSVSSPAGSTATSARARSPRTTRRSWRSCGTSSRRRSPPGTSPADP
jgi:hypothetical protein